MQPRLKTGPTEAGDRLAKTLEADPAALSFVALAQVRLDEGNAAEALEVCRRGLEHHPNHSTGHLLCGMALEAAGREDEALGEYREVIHLDPGNRIAAQRLGESYRRTTGKPVESPAIALPDDVEEEIDFGEEIAFFTHSMAEVYESQGFFEKALAIYRRVLTLQPNREDVRERIRTLERKIGVA